ncbi:MAG: hypothetical protein HKN33_18955, partial [Pyrinomonadaceae bacterium]|nr:hypothetical protein [Pyrinomonadaceae bacterium]
MEGPRERIEKLSPRQLELLENELGKISTSSGTGNKRLDAYVTDTEKSPEEIRESLKKRLPEYMVPANIFIVEQLPKLPNGKVDFKALRSASQKEEVNESEKAGNQVEYELLEIWKEVLRLERIGINDNFFEIGGDSILSIRIVGLARKKRIVIEPNQLFENQTIAELAAIAKVEESESDVQVEKSQGAFSLTPIQLWFFDEIRTAPHFWHQGLRFELSESVGQEISKEALGQLVQRHDALRSIYKKDENGWTGAIVTEPEIIQTVFDLTDSDPRYLEDEIRLRTDTA